MSHCGRQNSKKAPKIPAPVAHTQWVSWSVAGPVNMRANHHQAYTIL